MLKSKYNKNGISPLYLILILIIFGSLFILYFLPSLRNQNFGFNPYYLQESYLKYQTQKERYEIVIIADMDKTSRTSDGQSWKSMLLKGILSKKSDGKFQIEWSTNPMPLVSQLNEGGRGMELSELVFFNNKLISFDDRTGIVFEITPSGEAIPINILMDGNGRRSKGFKTEWATVKDGKIYVGSIGREWIQDGQVKGYDALWIKTIDIDGRVEHIDWTKQYNYLRKVTSTLPPGYLLHEAVSWSPLLKKWAFLPRRVSHEPYDEALDEERCGNLALLADTDIVDGGNVDVKTVGPLNKLHGFSSVKFFPFSDELIVTLKTQERDEVKSFISVHNLRTDEVLLEETFIANVKFEGVEFI